MVATGVLHWTGLTCSVCDDLQVPFHHWPCDSREASPVSFQPTDGAVHVQHLGSGFPFISTIYQAKEGRWHLKQYEELLFMMYSTFIRAPNSFDAIANWEEIEYTD